MYKKFETLLEKHNVTPYEVSKQTQISTSTLSEWKKGLYEPKIDKLKKLADFFHVPLDYFLEE